MATTHDGVAGKISSLWSNAGSSGIKNKVCLATSNPAKINGYFRGNITEMRIVSGLFLFGKITSLPGCQRVAAAANNSVIASVMFL